MINPSFELLEPSQNLSEIIGSQKKTLPLVDIVHPDDWPQVRQLMTEKCYEELKFDCRVKNSSDTFRWFSWEVKWIEKDQKYIVHLKLKSNENTAQQILGHISSALQIGFWEYDVNTMRLHWCDKGTEILGNEPQPGELATSLLQQFTDDSARRIKEGFALLLKFKKETDCELLLRKGVWLKVTAKPICANGVVTHIVGTLQDITKEIKKTELIFKNNIELSAIDQGLEQFSIVARTDARGKIIYANEKFCQLSKYTHEELIGKDHRILNSGHHPKEFWKQMWGQVIAGKPWRGEVKNRAKDGTYYWVDTVIVPIFDAQGKLSEILSFRYDITALKKLVDKTVNKSVVE
jgi:PAS domain S-box-containing protein